VSGILENSNKAFLEGIQFSAGETLLAINKDKFESEVFSKRSSFMNKIANILPDLKYDYPDSYSVWEQYLKNFDVEKFISPIPEPFNEKEKYYLAGKSVYTDYYNLKSQEEQLRKYTISAPFNGEVIESNIKPGTLVMSGQKLGEFVNANVFDLVVGVDLNNLHGIEAGNNVKLYSNATGQKWTGKLRRISNKIDDKTQMVNVYISVSGKGLKESMFLNADISLSHHVLGIEIPRKLLADSEHVFIVDDNKVHLQEISVIQRKENTVIIEGLPNGSLLALKTSGIHEGLLVDPVKNMQ
jgi:multidrug efflux pump subunit AcrA (membrane-fusion protein)